MKTWHFTSSSKVGYKAINLFFVNIVYILNVATLKLGFLKAKLSDMISTGKLLEKSRILEKFSIMVRMASKPDSQANKARYVRIKQPTRCSKYPKFIFSLNSTCFGHLLCPSSEVIYFTLGNWYVSCWLCDRFLAVRLELRSNLTLLRSGHITSMKRNNF